jgi:ligand-binding SRPBCC domain-containing protein
MTTLTNQITIAAPRGAVWQALTDLDLLGQYDPGVRSCQLVGEQASGLGAQRRCDLRPAGWFIERVAAWRPEEALAFELVTCSFPVSSLRHDYTLTQAADRTIVTQVMTYELKYGLAGKALDATVMRRQWDRGIKGFLHGLQQHVQAQHAAPIPE